MIVRSGVVIVSSCKAAMRDVRAPVAAVDYSQSPSSTPAGACCRIAAATLSFSLVAKLSTSLPALKKRKRGTLCSHQQTSSQF